MQAEDFERSMQFSILNLREREFVLAIIEGKNIEDATKSAYPRAKNHRVLCWRLRNSERVLDALNLWFGASPIPALSAKDAAISDVKKDIRKLKGVARVQARRLLLQLEGLIQ